MAARLWKTCNNLNLNPKISYNLSNQVRHGHHLRGKPPGVARSLEQRLEEINLKDPKISFKINIGFPGETKSRSKELFKRLELIKKNRRDANLEKLARDNKLTVNLEEIHNDWLATAGPHQIKQIAEHYGIYEHLFGDAYFVPRVPLQILFDTSPIYYGNIIKPAEAKNKPSVTFESDEKSLWTLILTNPDGHLTEKDSEYVHWFVGNIPGNDLSKGETIINYLQPFPPKGTGYHRHVFILYKQNKKLDFTSLKKSSKFDLKDRTFSTLNFYRDRQDEITPAGLAFFQSDWDTSLKDFYHKNLEMKEPIFEYDFPPPYIRPQTWFPLKQPFNLYLDKYQDPKKVSERYFKMKLKDVHPFKPPKEKLPFPNAEYLPQNMPSWLKLEVTKNRLGWGRINDV